MRRTLEGCFLSHLYRLTVQLSNILLPVSCFYFPSTSISLYERLPHFASTHVRACSILFAHVDDCGHAQGSDKASASSVRRGSSSPSTVGNATALAAHETDNNDTASTTGGGGSTRLKPRRNNAKVCIGSLARRIRMR